MENLKNGTTIYAVDPCIMNISKTPALTIGKAYIYQYQGKGEFSVVDDHHHTHYFHLMDFDRHFSLSPPVTGYDFQANTMKNSKGETLPQPYFDLALMRMWQQPEFAKRFEKKFNTTHELYYAFDWDDTPEKDAWWYAVYKGETPEIPAASIAELEAWRKSREENKQSDFWGKAAMVANELRDEPVSERKFKAGDKARIVGNTFYHQFKIGEIVILDQINTSGMSWRCYDLDKKDWWNVGVSDMELVEPAEPDYKAMYEDVKGSYEILDKSLHEALEKLQEQTSRNWIAECAMGIMAETGECDTAWNRAEAWAAEGKKRGHLPNNQK